MDEKLLTYEIFEERQNMQQHWNLVKIGTYLQEKKNVDFADNMHLQSDSLGII